MLADYSDTDKRDFSPLEEKIGALLNDEDDIAGKGNVNFCNNDRSPHLLLKQICMRNVKLNWNLVEERMC